MEVDIVTNKTKRQKLSAIYRDRVMVARKGWLLCLFDSIVIWLFKIHPDQEKHYQINRGAQEADEKGLSGLDDNTRHIEHILREMQIVDSKSSALLTHVSIMLVVASFFLPEGGEPDHYVFLIYAELIGLAAVALILLRCVDIMGPGLRKEYGNGSGINDDLNLIHRIWSYEILIRRTLYQSLVRCMAALTGGMVLAAALKWAS